MTTTSGVAPHNPELHLILCTHTAMHLRRCLLSCASQQRAANTVTLSCDVESREILDTVQSACDECSLPITVVQRPHTGKARCSQVRNNAVRALLGADRPPSGDARLVFLDGDTCLSHKALALHESLGGTSHLISTYRVNLTKEQTEGFDEAAFRAGHAPVALNPAQLQELRTRHARYVRQGLWRRLGLGKAHKPRLIGGHFSVPLAAYLKVNGCDEMYEGYGQEDDDLTRRLWQAGFPTRVAVRDILVYHLFHPTRAPGDWHAAPGVARFQSKTPMRAERGVENPVAQGELSAYAFRPGVPPRVFRLTR